MTADGKVRPARKRRLFNGLVVTPIRVRLATPARAISNIQQ